MDRNTFSQEEVADLLNEKFYPVKFDAEQVEDVVFRGHTFEYVATSETKGYHQLAASLLSNKLAYPSQVFLDENFNMLQPIQGYQEPVTFHKIIQFIGEDHFKSMKWDEWQAIYKSPFAAASKPVPAPGH